MPRHHSSVAYVEPNDVNTFEKGVISDGGFYDRSPNMEDYCIALDIEVELSSREDSVRSNDRENNVIIMSYRSGKDGSSVNFMSGSKLYVGGSLNMLTTKYADMYVTDLVDYGTTEMLGIKSVDIEYSSACVPVITIKFTDVRGMSLFQPTELNKDKSYNVVRGFSTDNIAQSFFHSFFVLPLPRFTIRLKGFYGKPVSYVVMCDKFDAQFNSKTGDFDVTTRFIGFAYSFMSDVSLDALLAAPYSDYFGEQYWRTNVDNGRFTIPDKNGTGRNPMPRLYDVRKYFMTLLNESDTDMQDTTIESEELTHDLEISELNGIRNMFREWYKSLYTIASVNYGSDFVFAFGGEKDEDYRRIVILANGSSVSQDSLSNAFMDNDGFKKISSDLYSKIEQYNSSNKSYAKIENISPDMSKYRRVRTFNDLWYDYNKKEIIFDGFHRDNILPRTETINVIFNQSDRDRRLRKIYNDGVDQYVDAFVIEQDYSSVTRRIKALIEDANRSIDSKQREAKLKEHNRHMFEKMGWYPTIENFTKIVMAHFETLIAMMFDVVTQTQGRTASELGVTTGEDGNCCDVNGSTVPPFPRVTKIVTDSDGITKREDAWIGDFQKGKGFKEIDMINGLLNAISKLAEIEKGIQATIEEQNRDMTQAPNGKCIVKYPLTPFDFFLEKNPYGTENDISNDSLAFAGKICMRMFDILSVSHFREELGNEWINYVSSIASTEAQNFYSLVKITNVRLMEEIGVNGSLSDGSKILNIVTGKVTSVKMPWAEEAGIDSALFDDSNGLWLTKYKTSSDKTYTYPIQGMSFGNASDALMVLEKGKVPVENNDISVSEIDNYRDTMGKILKSENSNVFNTLYIGKSGSYVSETIENAAAESVESYKAISEKVSDMSKLDNGMYKKLFRSSEDFISSFNGKISESIGNGKGTARYKSGEIGMHLYIGDEEYVCTPEALSSYFDNEISNGSIDSVTITESFGFKEKNDGYVIDKDTSLFLMDEFYDMGSWTGGGYVFESYVVKTAFFLMGIDCFDYSGLLSNLSDKKTFCNIPNLLALQLGVLFAAHAAANGNVANYLGANGFKNMKKKIHFSNQFTQENVVKLLNNISPLARIKLIKYFTGWAKNNFNSISRNFTIKYNEETDKYSFGSPSSYAAIYEDEGVKRALFNQDYDSVKNLTNDLMLPVMVVRETINAHDASRNTRASRTAYKLDAGVATTYLNAFLEKLRELYKVGEPEEESNNATTIAKDASQTNDDIKMELYRYLKQLFDKWIPTTKFEEWKYENFFTSSKPSNVESIGNSFYFIDSYYNNIASKLLINPLKLSEKIGLSNQYTDVNIMMYNFLADVFGEHRCMIKCVQNFRDLSKGMEDMFQPLPYNSMGKIDKFQDFVVVYTYAPSKNLNVDDAEFNDDGFMLNDELETPLAIRSRGDTNEEGKDIYYKIPAFGVSYGRQYQSYFKDVNVNMSNPIMTQQALIAKHSILRASKNDKSKVTTAQDLYDIYANQSYTCRVEMMGCAWIQPMMYFVLLNVPMFRGSYMIMKVTHRIRPGDMSTEFVGCRMANVSNKLVEDIFTEETDENTASLNYSESKKYLKADIDNDCPYKVYPVSEDNYDKKKLSMTDEQKEKGYGLMKKLMALGAEPPFAAGVVGNMFKESKFDHTALNNNDKGYFSGGLCQWRAGNLLSLLENKPGKYGRIEEKNCGLGSNSGGASNVKVKLQNIGETGQIKFLVDTLTTPARKTNFIKNEYNLSKFNQISNPYDAALKFRENYEISEHVDAERWQAANTLYEYYMNKEGLNVSSDKDTENKISFAELFFNAVQKSALSSPSTSVKLKPTYNGKNMLMLQQSDGKTNKLGMIFDIILNGYYDYVQNLNWIYKNSYLNKEDPIGISVVVNESRNVNNSKRLITVYKDSSPSSTSGSPFTEKDISKDSRINETLLRSIAKRYGASDNQILVKEFPQFASVTKILDEYKPENCDNLFNGGSASASNVKGVPGNANIMIDDWNVKNAVEYILANAKPKSGKECAKYVELAIQAGGGPLKDKISCTENGAPDTKATNLRYYGILKTHGFERVYNSDVNPGGNTSFSLQAGDVCIIGHKSHGKFHACMWTGDKWVSDYKQTNMISSKYPKSDAPYPYAIFRFHGKEGTVIA